MANGVSGYVDFAGDNGITLRIHYAETYDITTNQSTVSITKIQVAGSKYQGIIYYLDGTITIEGTTVISLASYYGTHSVYLSGLNNFCDVSGDMGSLSGIAHNDDGSRSISIGASITFIYTGGGAGHGTKISNSQAVTLTTIPRKSALSTINGTLGAAQTLSVTRQSASFTHTIIYKCGSASGTICTKSSSTSISWTPPLSLATQNTTGTNVSVVLEITTYSGDTSIGSNSCTISCAIPASVKPSCTISVSDAMGYLSTFGAYVQGYSKFKVTVTPTTSYGSAINSTAVTADGTTYHGTSVTTNVIKGTGTLTITATVTDQRGRSGSASVTVTVLAYTSPAISLLSAVRCNSDGTVNNSGDYIKVTMTAKVIALSNKNTAAYKVEYKKSSASSYTAVTLSTYANNYSVSGMTYIFAADTSSSYDVRFTVTDSLNSLSQNTSASTGFVLMRPKENGQGMGFGKVPERDGLDLGFPLFMNGHEIRLAEITKKKTFCQTDSDFNVSLNVITAYPTLPGVYRVGAPVAGLPSGVAGYGCLVIFNGGSYAMHLYIDANNTLYFTRTDSGAGYTFSTPSSWKYPTTTTVASL